MILTMCSASFSAISSIGHLAVGYLTGESHGLRTSVVPSMSHLEPLFQTFGMAHVCEQRTYVIRGTPPSSILQRDAQH